MNNKLKLICLAFLCFALIASLESCKKDDDCEAATIANAGDNQNVIGSSTTLAANAPAKGVGSWSIVSGDGGTIADPLNPGSQFTGTVGTTYVLKWSITGCPASEDEVEIILSCDPTSSANAGPDQNIAGTSATLAANSPTSGSGTWSIVSGTGGTIANPTSPSSTFSGTVGTTYTLRWTVSCPSSQDDVQISFNDGSPKLLTVDKTSVLNGEIITVTGINFSSNMNGGSQINIKKTADPYINQEVYLYILSRTATEIKAIVNGTNGGAPGDYALRYNKKPDANAAVIYPSNLSINITSATANQFFTSQTFTNGNVTKGAEASFGVKNGSLVASDYTIKMVKYDYTTGVATEYDATVTSVTANGYGSTMDKLAFTVPAAVPSATYYVKVTYGGKTLAGGWGVFLNVN